MANDSNTLTITPAQLSAALECMEDVWADRRPSPSFTDEDVAAEIERVYATIPVHVAAAAKRGLPRFLLMTVEPAPGFSYSPGLPYCHQVKHHRFQMAVLNGVAARCKDLPVVSTANGTRVQLQARVDHSTYTHLFLQFVDLPRN